MRRFLEERICPVGVQAKSCKEFFLYTNLQKGLFKILVGSCDLSSLGMTLRREARKADG